MLLSDTYLKHPERAIATTSSGRDSLPDALKTDGRVVIVTDEDRIQKYDVAGNSWVDILESGWSQTAFDYANIVNKPLNDATTEYYFANQGGLLRISATGTIPPFKIVGSNDEDFTTSFNLFTLKDTGGISGDYTESDIRDILLSKGIYYKIVDFDGNYLPSDTNLVMTFIPAFIQNISMGDSIQVGDYKLSGNDIPDPGYKKLDGSEFDPTQYPEAKELADEGHSIFKVNDGVYTVADFRGYFMRLSGTNEDGTVGTNLGEKQSDSTKLPNNQFQVPIKFASYGSHNNADKNIKAEKSTPSNRGTSNYEVTGGDSETRPKNIGVNAFVKISPDVAPQGTLPIIHETVNSIFEDRSIDKASLGVDVLESKVSALENQIIAMEASYGYVTKYYPADISTHNHQITYTPHHKRNGVLKFQAHTYSSEYIEFTVVWSTGATEDDPIITVAKVGETTAGDIACSVARTSDNQALVFNLSNLYTNANWSWAKIVEEKTD